MLACIFDLLVTIDDAARVLKNSSQSASVKDTFWRALPQHFLK